MTVYLATEEVWNELRKELSPRDLDLKPRSVGATKLALSKKFSKDNFPKNSVLIKCSYLRTQESWCLKYIIPVTLYLLIYDV